MKQFFSLIIALALFASFNTSYGQETKYKALYLYNFTKHVGWPPTAKEGDFVIGVIGNTPVFDELNKIASGKLVGSQKIVVKKFNNIDDMVACHIVFVSNSKTNNNNMEILIQKIENNNTLVVTEKENFISKGASINFVIKDSQMRIELSKENAWKQGLQISANLEKLAIET